MLALFMLEFGNGDAFHYIQGVRLAKGNNYVTNILDRSWTEWKLQI